MADIIKDFLSLQYSDNFALEGIEEKNLPVTGDIKTDFSNPALIHFSKLKIGWQVNLIWIHPRNGFYLFQVSHLMKKILNV